jgi:rod shape-determining protein MreD
MTYVDPERLRLLPPRARIVPVAATLAGSLLQTLPLVATAPVMPPLGLLMLLAWRLLRPELWPAWVALPLGLFDDLVSGQPLGSATALWTASFLLLDMVDDRLVWRDYWIEWAVAAGLIFFCMGGGWAATAFTAGTGRFEIVVPQLIITILCFPAAVRLCAVLDRWRLRRAALT